MCSTSKDNAVHARMCSANRTHINTSEDVQYKQVYHQVLIQGALLRNAFQCIGCAIQASISSGFDTGGTTQKCFPMNEYITHNTNISI